MLAIAFCLGDQDLNSGLRGLQSIQIRIGLSVGLLAHALNDLGNPRVSQNIVNLVPTPAGAQYPLGFHQIQLLGHVGLLSPQELAQGRDRSFPSVEQIDYLKTNGMGYGFEDFSRTLQLNGLQQRA
jgi:hypothetical protein